MIRLALVPMLMLGVVACQPSAPAPATAPLPPPPLAPPPPISYQPPPLAAAPTTRSATRHARRQGRCPPGQHWQASRRVLVKSEGQAAKTRVVPGHCV